MKKQILISIISILMILPSIAFATGSISISSVSIPTSVTQGDSFTITVSVSGSQATSVSGSLTLPSGLSCTPATSQSISLSGGGTGSASWSCTANVAGDYSNQITVSVTATDSGTGGSLSDTKQTGLTVLSPASLAVSSTISSSSISAGGSSTFTVGVNNAGDSSTTFNITLTCPSGLTCTPSSLGNTAISGKSLVNTPFTITGNSAGSYTIIATVNSPSQSGLTSSQSLSVAGTATTTTSSSGGGGGGGGGAGTTTTSKATTTTSQTTQSTVSSTTTIPTKATTTTSQIIPIPSAIKSSLNLAIIVVAVVIIIIIAIFAYFKFRAK